MQMLRDAFTDIAGGLADRGAGDDDVGVPRVTLRQLVYFASAARHGSALHAAESLSISPPAVSGAIAALEGLLGERLFVRRHARGLVLTEAGHELLREAREVIGQVQEIEAKRAGRGRRVRRQITLGCLGDIAPALVPPLVRQFQAQHPGMEVRWFTDGHPQLMTRLEEDSADVIFVLDFEVAPSYQTAVLRPTPVLCVLPADHPRAAGPVRLADLVEEPLVLLEIPRTREYFLSVFSGLGLRPHIAHRVQSAEMVRSLVAHGFGYSLLNFNPGGRHDIVYRGLAGYEHASNLVAVRKHGHPASRLLDGFVDCAQGFLQRHSGMLGLH